MPSMSTSASVRLSALARPAAAQPAYARAPQAQMTNLFTKRTFFIAAPFVGNNDFDPLGLASAGGLVPLRHAEVKHGRLAMLAAVAWPMQEAAHPAIVSALQTVSPNVRNILDATDGFTPGLFHGGLDAPEVSFSLALAMCAAAVVEVKDVSQRMAAGLRFNEWASDSVAGDLEFDPLDLATELNVTDRYELQEAEMINGRLAQLAVLSYIFIECVAGVRVVDFPALL